jgi:hypothetical protein
MLMRFPCTSATAARAERQSPSIDVYWSAPAGCPDRARLIELVEDHLGRALTSRDRVMARILTARRAGVYSTRVLLRVGGRSSERDLEGVSCGPVADAIALMIALSVRDDDVRDNAPRGAAGPTPLVRPRTSRHRLAIVVAAAAGAGMLPDGNLGGVVGVSAARRRWSLALEGTFWLEREVTFDAAPMAGAVIDGWTIASRACRVLAIEVCLGGEAGRLQGDGFGYDGASEGSQTWIALAVGARAELDVSALFSVIADAEGLLPLVAPTFCLGDGTPIYEPFGAAARVRIGVAVHIP